MKVIRTLFKLTVEYLLFLPLFVLVGALLVGTLSMSDWLGSIFLAYIIGAIFRLVGKAWPWFIYGLFALIVSVTASIMLGDSVLMQIMLSILYAIFIYRGMVYITRSKGASLPVLWVGGLLLYFISYFLFRYMEDLSDYLPIITNGAIGFVISTLIVSNMKQLTVSSSTKEEQSAISSATLWQNRLYLALIVLVIGALSFGNKAQTSVIYFIRWLVHLLTRPGEYPEVPVETPNSAPEVGELLEVNQEPALFWVIMEKVMIYTMYLVLACLVLGLLLLVMNKTRKWLVRIVFVIIYFLKKLLGQSETHTNDGAYVEEKESIFNWRDWKEARQEKAKAWMARLFKRRKRWGDLTNEEKVRFVYQNVVEKKVTKEKWNKADTPREALSKVMEQPDPELLKILQNLYEETRYGELEMNEEQIKQIVLLLK